MIGCPVGSIHRGDNGQIVIEDWCIGCQMCAKQCPYGSILMHDTGVIPEEAYDWRVTNLAPGDSPGANSWTAPNFRDRGWARVQAPFAPGRDTPTFPAYALRHEFTLDKDQLGPGDEFKVEVTTPPA